MYSPSVATGLLYIIHNLSNLQLTSGSNNIKIIKHEANNSAV